MNKSIWFAWAIKNSVVVICWTVLAIHFDKWWIAIFAVFMLSSVERKTDSTEGHR